MNNLYRASLGSLMGVWGVLIKQLSNLEGAVYGSLMQQVRDTCLVHFEQLWRNLNT